MPTEPLFYVLAVVAVVMMGLAKGGFAGLGVLAVPLLSLAVSPVQAASITLPILVVQDVISVWLFRRTWDAAVLRLMLPFAALGIVAGYALAAFVSSNWIELAVGITSIAFAAHRLWVERHGLPQLPAATAWTGAVCALAAGFTSQIAHAGAPPFQMYVLTRRLPRDVFIGTSAIFFAVVNWMKVPAYAALGQLTRGNLATAAALLPLAVVSTWAGAWLVRRVSGLAFYRLIYLLLASVGVKLAWDGLAGIAG
jgi:uncharacterized membrane protein YfcA